MPPRTARHLFSWMSAGAYFRKPRFRSRSMRSFAQIACMRAARQIASSTRVAASHTRNSIVGYNACGRRSHQIFLPSSMDLVFTRSWTKFSNSS